uniref:Large ribosomal subunit protein mL48 n=1 Tax=Pseudonaja textilis TaxID=8673 RepID=A0A670Z2P4_PSETE
MKVSFLLCALRAFAPKTNSLCFSVLFFFCLFVSSFKGSLRPNFQRHYRSMPTHGIGRYRHLLPPEAPPKRKNHVEMKEIDPGTEHQYGTLNIVMTGYDVCLVEHYAQYVHRLCNKLSVNVVESYAMPTKTIELVLTGEHGSKVRVDGHLTSHQRVVQIKQLTATFSPIFLEIIQNNLPEGVHLLVKEVCGFLLKYLN